MVTASEVGGDYYDVLPTGDDGCWVGIGDVSGHGLNAGLMMLMIQSGVSSLVRRDPGGDPAALLCLLNRMLFENVRRRLRYDHHATMSLLRFGPDGRFAMAGAHEDMLLWRTRTGRCQEIPTPGTWVGAKADISSHTTTTVYRMEPGDVLLLYTDGLIEAANSERERLGIERLALAIERLAGEPVSTICDRLFEDCERWAPVREDDQTAVVLRYRGV
jgi:serine phosphatase RsbU (regulator of sigma subunit)